MKVTLIDYTGAGSADALYAARLLVYTKSTRLEQGAETRDIVLKMSKEKITEELKYIANTIRSSWEFVDYTFEIKGVTRAFTHQFVRTRTGSYAQQAQRVVNMSGFEALEPETIKSKAYTSAVWTSVMGTLRLAYKELSDAGIPTQDARGLLPTNVLTNIIAKFNLRAMADLTGKRDNARAQGEYVDVFRAMKTELLAVHPWAEPFLNPERTKTPNLDAILKEVLGSGTPLADPRLNGALKELDLLKGVWG